MVNATSNIHTYCTKENCLRTRTHARTHTHTHIQRHRSHDCHVTHLRKHAQPPLHLMPVNVSMVPGLVIDTLLQGTQWGHHRHVTHRQTLGKGIRTYVRTYVHVCVHT